MKPYLVTVVLNPTKKQVDDNEAVPVIVVEPKSVLAKDESQARFKAARLVPEEHADKDARLEVYVLPLFK